MQIFSVEQVNVLCAPFILLSILMRLFCLTCVDKTVTVTVHQ